MLDHKLCSCFMREFLGPQCSKGELGAKNREDLALAETEFQESEWATRWEWDQRPSRGNGSHRWPLCLDLPSSPWMTPELRML